MDGWNTTFLLGRPILRISGMEKGRRMTQTFLPSLKLTAKAPENGWLEYYFPIRKAYFEDFWDGKGEKNDANIFTLPETNCKSP